MGILISLLYPNVVLANGLYMWYNLNLDDVIAEDRLIFNVFSIVSHLKCCAPQIPKILKKCNV